MPDHGRVRRAYDDPIKQPDLKPAAKQAAHEQPTNEAADGAAIVQSLQRAAGNAAVGALLAEQHGRAQPAQSGEALAPSTRDAAERKLGSDLGDVRVHSDAAASEYARSLRAEAVTVDQDVFLTSGVDTSTQRGQKTLLHELVHAAQTSNVAASKPPAESEARAISAGGFGGVTSRPRERASSGAPHLKAADEDENVAAPGEQPAPVTAQELLNPPASTEDAGPEPGASGENESVAFEITIMEPLRSAQQAVEEQDWDKAYEILQSIGVRMMNYQNTYEKSNPMLYQSFMSARGWLSVWYQQLERRLDKDTWSDGQMTSFFKNEVVDVFQRIEGQLH